MDELKVRIRELSASAARLSKQAIAAFKQRDFAQGKQLMAQAVSASKDCQRLIQQYQESVGANPGIT